MLEDREKSKEILKKYNLSEEQVITSLLESNKDDENASTIIHQSVVRKKILN